MTNKVYVLAPREDWIVDRFVNEWNEDNADITVRSPIDSDVIWLMADWCFDQLNQQMLASKKVITTIHHIVPEKFSDRERARFMIRDRLTTIYHVPNQYTYEFIAPLTDKPIYVIPYWGNNSIWKKTSMKQVLRLRYSLPINAFIVGSIVRDTEGAGISQGIYLPKCEKGPDLLANYLEWLHTTHQNLHVLLAGWRRQYIIARLEKARIPYTYFERPSQEVINELYQCIDLYPVTARQEGGPQSLIECGLLGIHCISRPVGIADQVLPSTAIHDDVSQAIPAVPNVEALKLPMGYEPYRKLIASL